MEGGCREGGNIHLNVNLTCQCPAYRPVWGRSLDMCMVTAIASDLSTDSVQVNLPPGQTELSFTCPQCQVHSRLFYVILIVSWR